MSLTSVFFDRMTYLMMNDKVEVTTVRNADATEVIGFIDSRALNLYDQLTSGVLNSEFKNYFTNSNLFSLYVQNGGLGDSEFKVLTQDCDLHGNKRESKLLSVQEFKENFPRQSEENSHKYFRKNEVFIGAKVPEWLVIGTLEFDDVPADYINGKKTFVRAGDMILFPYERDVDIKEQLEEIMENGFESSYWGVGSGRTYKECDENGVFKSKSVCEFYELDYEPENI